MPDGTEKGKIPRHYKPAKAREITVAKREAKAYPKCAGKTGQARKNCMRDVYGRFGGATGKGKK